MEWSKKVLLEFSNNRKDTWTIDDAVKGTSILGGTGSGKTTSSGKLIAKKFLENGWGGLVLCAKTDEAELWQEYCKDAERLDDLIIFGQGNTIENGDDIVFNPIDYELRRGGAGSGEIHNLVNIFMNMYKMGNRIAGEGEGGKDDRFWDSALKRVLSRVLELLKLSGEDLTYENMILLMSSSFNTGKEFVEALTERIRQKISNEVPEEELFSDGLEEDEHYCTYCLVKAQLGLMGDSEEQDLPSDHPKVKAFTLITNYFYEALPNMGEQVRATIIESFMGLAEPFLSGILNRHFSGKTNLFPEKIYKEHKIIVLNFPVKEYLDAGILAQSVFKLMFQQAMERRDTKEYPRPCFLWADEAQYFINPYDQIFLTTARSSRTATVFLSQNISNYYSALGSSEAAKPKVNSFLGNLATKIFHANSDTATTKYSSLLIGDALQLMSRQNMSQGLFNLDIKRDEGTHAQYLPQVQPTEFTMLKSGGVNHDYEVESIVFITGKTWSNGKNHFRATFKQEFKELTATTIV